MECLLFPKYHLFCSFFSKPFLEVLSRSTARKYRHLHMWYIWILAHKLVRSHTHCILGTRAKYRRLGCFLRRKSHLTPFSKCIYGRGQYLLWTLICIVWNQVRFRLCTFRRTLPPYDWYNSLPTSFLAKAIRISNYYFLQIAQFCWQLASRGLSRYKSNLVFNSFSWSRQPAGYSKF